MLFLNLKMLIVMLLQLFLLYKPWSYRTATVTQPAGNEKQEAVEWTVNCLITVNYLVMFLW